MRQRQLSLFSGCELRNTANHVYATNRTRYRYRRRARRLEVRYRTAGYRQRRGAPIGWRIAKGQMRFVNPKSRHDRNDPTRSSSVASSFARAGESLTPASITYSTKTFRRRSAK